MSPPSAEQRLQKRHTIAAVIYFLYGLFYLFGAQYLTTIGMSARGISNSKVWFLIGGIILVVFPILIYKRFAIGLALRNRTRHDKTLWINFTLLLGIAVSFKIFGLLRDDLYMKSPLHLAGLIVVIINTMSLLWAGFSKPVWITRQT